MTEQLRVGLAAALATAAISGVAVFLNGLAVSGPAGPAAHTTAKNLVAAVVLGGALLLATRRRPGGGWTRPVGRAQAAGLVFVALAGGGVAFVLFFEGLAAASSTDAAFLHKTLVLWVALAAPFVLGERVGWPVAAGVGGLLVGQALLVGDLGALGPGRAEGLILLATLVWAAEVLVAKRLLRALSPLTVGTVRLAGGLPVLVAWLAASGGVGPLVRLGLEPWLWVVGTGVVLAGYVACWCLALARAPATVVTAVLVLAVPITASLDATLRGRSVADDLAALALVTIAVVGVLAAARVPRPADLPAGSRA